MCTAAISLGGLPEHCDKKVREEVRKQNGNLMLNEECV